jgi:hypothetical protein
MFRAAIAAIACAVVCAAAPAHAAETYYRCETGFVFEASGDSAHCKKPQTVTTTTLQPCAAVTTPVGSLGTFEAIDKITGGRDQCTGTNPVTGEVKFDRTCPAGYTYRIVNPGRDRCERTVPAQFRAPSLAVQR